MLDEGIAEAPRDRFGERHQIRLGQRQRRDDLVVERLLHEGGNHRVVHRVQHDVIAALEGSGDEGRVRAVEDSHLALLVRLLIISVDDGQPALRQGQFVGKVAGGFDDPQTEGFSGVQQVVLIAQLLPNCLILAARIAGHDTVNKRGGEHARRLQPLLELLAQRPLLRQRLDALFQHDAVVVNQLDRQDDESLVLRIAECFGALEEELRQLAGVGFGRAEGELIRLVQHDAGFGRVADDEAQRRQLGVIGVVRIVRIRIHGVGHGRDHARLLHRLTVHQTAQHDRVAVILFLERREQRTHLNRLHQRDRAVEVALLVGNINHVIHKGAQEVAFPELQHLDRADRRGRHRSIQTFHFDVPPSIHQACKRLQHACIYSTLFSRFRQWFR